MPHAIAGVNSHLLFMDESYRMGFSKDTDVMCWIIAVFLVQEDMEMILAHIKKEFNSELKVYSRYINYDHLFRNCICIIDVVINHNSHSVFS